jgi:hypothetical protein
VGRNRPRFQGRMRCLKVQSVKPKTNPLITLIIAVQAAMMVPINAATAPELKNPTALAFDHSGNLLVADDGVSAIFKFAADGTKSVVLEGRPEPTSEQPEEEADSSTGLAEKYAEDYLIASGTISPDKKFAVIYPTRDSEEFPAGANFVVSLKPFAVLGKLDTKWPYFKNESHGGLSADWSKDGSMALVTLDSKWGPGNR